MCESTLHVALFKKNFSNTLTTSRNDLRRVTMKIKLFSRVEKPYAFTVYAVLTPKRQSLDYWIIVPKIIVTHHSGNKCDSKQTRCLRHIWKQHENHLCHAILSTFRDKLHEFRLSNYFNHHKHKSIPIHSWNCEPWWPEKMRKKTHHATKNAFSKEKMHKKRMFMRLMHRLP